MGCEGDKCDRYGFLDLYSAVSAVNLGIFIVFMSDLLFFEFQRSQKRPSTISIVFTAAADSSDCCAIYSLGQGELAYSSIRTIQVSSQWSENLRGHHSNRVCQLPRLIAQQPRLRMH
jgi:hypothetical protein